MSAFVISQEAYVSAAASYLGVPRSQLSDERLRFMLSHYHAAYLPMAMHLESRATDIDIQTLYKTFGFDPETPTYSTGTLKVTLKTSVSNNSYNLPIGTTVVQNGLRYLLVEPLNIPNNKDVGEAAIKSVILGKAGTPQLGGAKIATAVSWLRGAKVEIIDIVPGRVGLTEQEIRNEFAILTSNPNALVKEEAHESFLLNKRPDIGRVIVSPRTKIEYARGLHTIFNETGNTSIAVVMENGDEAKLATRREIKELLLDFGIPYQSSTLHIVPLRIRQVQGVARVKKINSVDPVVVKRSAIEALGDNVDWRTWQAGENVTTARLHSVLSKIQGVQYVENVTIQGKKSDGSFSNSDYYLYPYELPDNGFTETSIEVV